MKFYFLVYQFYFNLSYMKEKKNDIKINAIQVITLGKLHDLKKFPHALPNAV